MLLHNIPVRGVPKCQSRDAPRSLPAQGMPGSRPRFGALPFPSAFTPDVVFLTEVRQGGAEREPRPAAGRPRKPRGSAHLRSPRRRHRRSGVRTRSSHAQTGRPSADPSICLARRSELAKHWPRNIGQSARVVHLGRTCTVRGAVSRGQIDVGAREPSTGPWRLSRPRSRPTRPHTPARSPEPLGSRGHRGH